MVLLLTGAAVLGGCGPGRETAGGTNGLNVVIIVSDALRPDVLGCYGGRVDTPNLDRLAASGVRFARAHATAPWTSPSAVSMVTGNHPSVYLNDITQVVPDRPSFYVPESVTTLPEQLAAAGYDLVYSAYNPNSEIANNFQGFRKLNAAGDDAGDPGLAARQIDELQRVTGLESRWEVHRRLAPFLHYLLRAPADTPFFGWCWIDDPHTPYSPHGRFEAAVRYPPTRFMQRGGKDGSYYRQKKNLHRFDGEDNSALTAQELQLFFRLYRAEAASVDERVGFVLDVLEHRGLLDDTLIIFTSDHGEAFKEHGQMEHGRSYYQELMRVPLIMSGPGIPAGTVAPVAVSHLDLMPTVRDLLAFDGVQDWQGESYAAAVRGGGGTVRPLYFEAANNMGGHDFLDALRQARFKLITRLDGGVELYDLSRDPAERENLAADRPQRVARLLEYATGIRTDNARRRAALADSTRDEGPSLDAAEKAEVLRKLKSLGYVN